VSHRPFRVDCDWDHRQCGYCLKPQSIPVTRTARSIRGLVPTKAPVAAEHTPLKSLSLLIPASTELGHVVWESDQAGASRSKERTYCPKYPASQGGQQGLLSPEGRVRWEAS